MNPFALLGAAPLLAVERVCYVWIARAPAAFRRWCARPPVAWLGPPVSIVGLLFAGFKVLQLAVFFAWCYVHGDGVLPPTYSSPAALVLGGALVIAGQVLNLGVFYRLRVVGVLFGGRLGHAVPWCRAFPFSRFSHPQYVGTVATIWGFFLAMRFPHPDWYQLPVLETLYYALGAQLEAWEGEQRLGTDPETQHV